MKTHRKVPEKCHFSPFDLNSRVLGPRFRPAFQARVSGPRFRPKDEKWHFSGTFQALFITFFVILMRFGHLHIHR